MIECDEGQPVAKVAAAWLDEALRSGFTHTDEQQGIYWLWVDDEPEVSAWPSYLEVCNYFDVLKIPIAGSAGIRHYEGSPRTSHTRKVIVPWETIGRLVERSPHLRQAISEILTRPS